VGLFYDCLEENGWRDHEAQKDFLLQLQKDECECKIPKKYSGGLLLVYLNLCKGYNI